MVVSSLCSDFLEGNPWVSVSVQHSHPFGNIPDGLKMTPTV